MFVLTATELEDYDVIMDPLTGGDYPTVKVQRRHNDVLVSGIDGSSRMFFPDHRVVLVKRSWPKGKTQADMQQKVEALARAFVDASEGPDRFNDGTAIRLLDALDAYFMGLSPAAIVASDPRVPSPIPL